MRPTNCAGSYYEESKEELMEQLASCYREAFGGEVPEVAPERKGDVLGLVSPHAGYQYSGVTAARGYGELARDGLPTRVILIGPVHSRTNRQVDLFALGDEDFITPLGTVQVDRELMDALWKKPLDKLNSTHRVEHSIESQLPFLQFFGHPFTIVPIAMGRHDRKTSKQLGKMIAEALIKTGHEHDTIIVASSDFSHLGKNYNNIPIKGKNLTGDDYTAWMEKYDGIAISKIEHMDTGAFFRAKLRFKVTACGAGPIATMMTATKMLGAHRAEKLDYTTSYEKLAQLDSVVGYASIVVRK
jgi:AmmeMemoRadiSam system protein B